MAGVSPVICELPELTEREMQLTVIAAFVHTVAVYDAGACGPAEAVKVTVMDPDELPEDAENPVGACTWLTAACGEETGDAGETR